MRRDNFKHLSSQFVRELKIRVYPPPQQDNGARLATQVSIEGLLAAIVLNLATVFTAMFATRLGADSSQIGLLSSLPQWAALAALIPGTILAGFFRHSRRPVETSLLATGLLYGLAGLAPYMGEYRILYLTAMVALANAPMALYNTTWQNYFSDVVPVNNRNSLYTMRTSMTFAAGIIIVQVTGLLLNQAASDTARIQLYQGCYFLAFAFSILQWLVIRQSPDIETEDNHIRLRQIKSAISDIISNKSFLAFIGISFFFHIGWYMAWPLFFLLQVNYMGANEAWLSYVLVSASLLQWATVKYWGRFIEKYGVRLTIVIGAAGLTVNPLFAILSSYLPMDWRMPGMLVFNLVNAATFSAFQLSLLQCLLEVLPRKNKQLNLSFYTALMVFSNALMQWFGVAFYVWLGDSHGAMSVSLAVSSLIRLIGTALFFWRWLYLRREPDAGRRFDL